MRANDRSLCDGPGHPGLLRRLAAMFYDMLLLTGVLFSAFVPVQLIPLSYRETAPGKYALHVYFVLVIFLFFGWFWTHGGQTLGMRAWRIKAVTHDNTGMGWGDALKRFVMAFVSISCAGLGLVWCLFQRHNMSWHDLYSGTKLVLMSKVKQSGS